MNASRMNFIDKKLAHGSNQSQPLAVQIPFYCLHSTSQTTTSNFSEINAIQLNISNKHLLCNIEIITDSRKYTYTNVDISILRVCNICPLSNEIAYQLKPGNWNLTTHERLTNWSNYCCLFVVIRVDRISLFQIKAVVIK